jgi:N-acetylglutamate synthase-like GNAT family acetyltransferase
MKIRRAGKEDSAQIMEILRKLDLYHPSRIPDDFWVADEGGKIVGVSCLTDYGDILFLSSVGVIEERREKGVAKAILEEILAGARKDIYLYTIIPDFFRKLGFEIVDAPPDIPSRECLGCESCRTEECVCMRRKA